MLLPALFIPDRLPASLFFAIRILEPEYIKSTWTTTWYMQWHEQVTRVSRPVLPLSGAAWLYVPWRQRQLVPPKHRQIYTWLHGVISHITLFFSILTRLKATHPNNLSSIFRGSGGSLSPPVPDRTWEPHRLYVMDPGVSWK